MFWSTLLMIVVLLLLIFLSIFWLITVLLASILVSIFLLITVLFSLILLVIVFSIFVICVPTWPFKSLIAFSLLEIRVEFASIRLLLSTIFVVLAFTLSSTTEIRVELSAILSCKKSKR